MRRSTSSLAFCIGALVLMGGTTTTTMSPTATVIAKCTITSPTALTFGSYDPVVAQRSSDLDVNASALSVSCTRGAPNVTIALDNGQYYAAPNRYMSDGSAPTPNLLQYEIYTTAGRTVVWNATNTVSYTSTSLASSTITVYGRIPGGQDANIAGSYSDTIVATVNF